MVYHPIRAADSEGHQILQGHCFYREGVNAGSQNQCLGQGTWESAPWWMLWTHSPHFPKPFSHSHTTSFPMMVSCTRGCVFQGCSQQVCSLIPILPTLLDLISHEEENSLSPLLKPGETLVTAWPPVYSRSDATWFWESQITEEPEDNTWASACLEATGLWESSTLPVKRPQQGALIKGEKCPATAQPSPSRFFF